MSLDPGEMEPSAKRDTTDPRVTLFSFAFPHCGRFSSYHRLADYSSAGRVVDATIPLQRMLPGLSRRIEPQWRRASEWRLRRVFGSRERQCVHYLYPGQSLFQGHKWKGRHGLVLTSHAPAARIQQARAAGLNSYLEALKTADRVVLLASDCLNGYTEFCEKDRLTVIPHGVDVHFFEPHSSAGRQPMVLTVGNWLRDYRLWADVVEQVATRDAQVQFTVVAAPATTATIQRRVQSALRGRVQFVSGLTDHQLRNLYQRAWLVFLPLIDATANNAILEAMACGTPLLVTDLPVTREYVGTCGDFFTAGVVDECVAKLTSMLQERSRREELGFAARRRAVEHFDWERIARRYSDLYRDVLAEGTFSHNTARAKAEKDAQSTDTG